MLNNAVWFIYNILFTIGMLLLSPYYLLHMRKRGGYWKNFSQRWANYNPDIVKDCNDTQRIWLHAVSVGECNLALKFISEFRIEDPDARFVLSVNTSTAHTLAEKNIDSKDVLIYFPLDIAPIINKTLKTINPKFIVLTEKEIWPNLVRSATKKNIPIFLINGTISEKSYKSYKKLSFIFKPIFASLTKAYMQSEEGVKRITDIGVAQENVEYTGSLKYVVTDVDSETINKMKDFLSECGFKDAIIITAASTWPGEEIAFANTFKKLQEKFENIKLIIIPRHAERREQIISELKANNQTFIQRSKYLTTKTIEQKADIILLDSTGEVKPIYALSSIAFVGKSMFENHGGHNIIEPATFSIPVITGPNTENFPIISQDFIREKAITIVKTEEDLYNTISNFLSNPDIAKAAGQQARNTLDKRLGNLNKVISHIRSLNN